MLDFWDSIWSNDLYQKFILTALILIMQNILHRLLMFVITRRVTEDSPFLYPIRKATSYAINILGAILIFGVWVERLGDFRFRDRR